MSNAPEIKGLPKTAYRFDEHGRPLIHYTRFRKNTDNPRDEADYGPEKNARLMDSIRSSKHGGIHLPVSVRISEGFAETIEGHLRVASIENIIKQILAEHPNISQKEKDKLTERYAWIPVTIEDVKDELQVLIRMQSSDSLKKHWSFPQRLKHVSNIYRVLKEKEGIASPDELDNDIAKAVGWDLTKLRIMVKVGLSKELMEAVEKYTTCTYKGWLHLVQIGMLLAEKRKRLMEDMTKIDSSKTEEFQEAIYKLLVKKLEYYVGTRTDGREKRKKAQPGSLLERVTPLIRSSRFPDARVKAWLKKKIDITPNGLERFTGANERKQKRTEFLRLIDEEQYDATQSEEDLRSSMEQLAKSAGPKATVVEPTDSVPLPAELEPKVTVERHTRSKPASVPTSKSFVLDVPSSKNRVFAEVVKHFGQVVRSSEVEDAVSQVQQSLLYAALAVLEGGRRKTA